ncbi:MAG TPA: extracellular solute-binding protein [Candidatus Dormibacteraeota bacterium]|jgi:putative aldouronate transport system substrate-binding protein|nr:extracellular solute-binding protein [Candidatus Dormibacteraeota bacterium]
MLGGLLALGGTGLLASCGGPSHGVVASCANLLSFDVKPPEQKPHEVISGTPNTPVAWTSFPEPYTSWHGDPPGNGGTVTTFQILYGAPPPPMSQNRWWQELNRRLGVTWQPTLVDSGDYATKLDTLASSGFPDLTYINFGQGGSDGTTSASFEKIVAEGAFHDLTDYVSGKGLNEFTNLPRLPRVTWADTTFAGRVYGVPYPIPPVNGFAGLYRKDWAEKLGVDQPKNAAQVLKMFGAFNSGHPEGKGNRTWAFGGLYGDLWNSMFRVPNNWRVNKDGSLTNAIETDEYRAAIDFSHQLWKAGAFYPDVLTQTFNQQLDLFTSGQVGYFAQGYAPLIGMMAPGPPPNLLASVPHAKPYPFLPPGHDGGKILIPSNAANFGFTSIPTTIKSEKRVVELLRVMDYMAAPFGSEEGMFIQDGIEGVMYNMVDGSPVSVSSGAENWCNGMNYLDMTGEINYFYPTNNSLALLAQQLQAEMIKRAVADPTQGLYSPTSISAAGTLSQLQTNTTNAILVGRQPLSALDGMISSWKSQGGNQMRKEFEQALKKCK